MGFGAPRKGCTGSGNQIRRREGGPRGGLPDSSKDGRGRSCAAGGWRFAAGVRLNPGKADADSPGAGSAEVAQTLQRIQEPW